MPVKKKTPARKKAPAKKAPARKKAPVRKKAPAKKAAPKKKLQVKKKTPTRKATARKATPAAEPAPLRVITPPFVLSFPHIFKPKASRSTGNEEYSCTMYFDKEKSDMSKIEAAIEQVITDQFKGKKAGLKLPIRDADDETDNYSTYDGTEGCWVLSAKSVYKVGVVDANREDIIDPSELYSGCICRASITAYDYNVDGNKGVSFALNNIQKLADGTPLAGTGQKAADEFETAEDVDLEDYETEDEAEEWDEEGEYEEDDGDYDEEETEDEEDDDEAEAEDEEELEVYENEDGVLVYVDEDGNEVEYNEDDWA